MAVYTEVSADELIPFVETYNIGSVLTFKGIAEGVENTNYMVQTDQDRFFLTLYEKRVSPQDLPFFLGLLNHLSDQGFPCPKPIHDREGRDLRELNGRPAAMVSFLDGLSVRRPKPIQCAELGQGLAKMHLLGEGFAIKRQNALGPGGWRELFESCRGSMSEGLPQLPTLEDEISNELASLASNWPVSLPEGTIHADLFPDNVFFIGDRLSGFIDFYFACNDLLAYDLAICLNAWCFEPDGQFNITKARALTNAYSSVRPLNAHEIAALPTLARGAALRFLLTRLVDWLTPVEGALVKPKDPREYVEKLRFHKNVKGPSAYGLD